MVFLLTLSLSHFTHFFTCQAHFNELIIAKQQYKKIVLDILLLLCIEKRQKPYCKVQ